MVEVTKEALEGVFTSLLSGERKEMQTMQQEDLEGFWFFRYDTKATLEWNAYQFHSMLDLYKSKCRRWEEMHNGNCCVVERVRDRYLMPKIREFMETIRAAMPDHIRLPTNRREAEMMILASEAYLRDLEASESKRA